MQKILVVEDEPNISDVLCDYLNDAGYVSHVIADGREVIAWVKAEKPSLILLDVMLPGKDGMSICREVRAFSPVPIIMLTARVEEIDRLLGLEMGADDYVCKPFSPREVVARVKANLRRASMTDQESTDLHGFDIDEQQYIARLDGQTLPLTRVEFRILQALLNAPGRIFSRDQLLDRMYDDQRVVSDRTVDSHMTNLRRKLQDVRTDSECIHSVYGLGYRLEL